MRIAIALVALAACGKDPVNRLPDGPRYEDAPAGGGDGGTTGDGGGVDAAPAFGCDMVEIAAQCPATLQGATTNTQEDAQSPFTLTLAGTSYDWQFTNNGQPGVVYPYDRHFSFGCTTLPDMTRAWTGGYRDNCWSTNSIGNFAPDYSFGTFETKVGRCPPAGTYAVVSLDPKNGDTSTCEDLGMTATLATP